MHMHLLSYQIQYSNTTALQGLKTSWEKTQALWNMSGILQIAQNSKLKSLKEKPTMQYY